MLIDFGAVKQVSTQFRLPQLACKPKAPEGVTVTRPHHSNQVSSSVSVSKAVEEVTVTRSHRAPVPQIIPATLPATQTGKTVAVAPALKKQSSSRSWFPGLGGAIATIATVSLGAALLKAQQAIPLPHESPNSTISSEQTSPPKATSSELKPPALISPAVSQPSTSSAPFDNPTSTPTTQVSQPVRVSPLQPHAAPIVAPASRASQPAQVVTPPQPHTLPIAAPASKTSQLAQVVTPLQPPPIAAPASKASQPVEVVNPPQLRPQVTGNEPTLNEEALREQEPPIREVGHQAKEAAKPQEREAKEASKQQEQEAKKAASKLEKGKH